MSSDSGDRSGVNKYLSNQTIKLVEKCLIPNLKKEKEKEVGFSEAVHEAIVFMKSKRHWTIIDDGVSR